MASSEGHIGYHRGRVPFFQPSPVLRAKFGSTFFKKLFDIPKSIAHDEARTRPLLNLRRKFLNSGVDFLPLSQGQVKEDRGRVGFTATCSVSSAHVAQSVEHILGKDEVTGSNPVMGLPLDGGW